MSTDANTNGPRAETATNDQTGQGWLAALRTRLGLAPGQTLRDTLEAALKTDAQKDAFTDEEREMLLRMLRFGSLRIDDVMVPRADIIALDERASVAEFLRTFEEAGVSRIPVFHETPDDIRGMVHIKDLVSWMTSEAAANMEARPAAEAGTTETSRFDFGRLDLSRPILTTKVRRPVLFVPPSMPAMNLLIRMQTTRIHMALVIDEYGGTDGLVSIEDLVEQIVGDIEDEHDAVEASHIIVDPKQGLIASARTPIRELENHLNIKLLKAEEETEIDTLGGLIFALIGRVPSRGELVQHASGVEFEVIDADTRRIKKVKVHSPKGGGETPGAVAAGK
jgi:CBS domain containing-hemolysin-like protein